MQLPDGLPSEGLPTEVDLSRPSAARVYDYFLGGAHNFQVDRQLAAVWHRDAVRDLARNLRRPDSARRVRVSRHVGVNRVANLRHRLQHECHGVSLRVPCRRLWRGS